MPYFDSHAHLSSSEMMPQIDPILARANLSQVTHILNICTDPQTLKDGIDLKRRYPTIYNAGATTPHDVEKEGEEAFPIFENAAKNGQIVALGETGLEYFHPGLDRNVQKKFLIRYLHLAQECNLPVIFHCREAFSDLFAITDLEYKGAAILHCFTGSLKEAEEVLKRGWFISFSGIVTFKKSEELRELAQIVPLNQMLIETDAPYLAPQPKRGKMNEPAFILETARTIAETKRISVEEIARKTFENSLRILKISH